MSEIEEPKKIPYTAETFPLWAVWIRDKKDEIRYGIEKVDPEKEHVLMWQSESLGHWASFTKVDDFEIAGCVPDGNGEIQWQPFYQVK